MINDDTGESTSSSSWNDTQSNPSVDSSYILSRTVPGFGADPGHIGDLCHSIQGRSIYLKHTRSIARRTVTHIIEPYEAQSISSDLYLSHSVKDIRVSNVIPPRDSSRQTALIKYGQTPSSSHHLLSTEPCRRTHRNLPAGSQKRGCQL